MSPMNPRLLLPRASGGFDPRTIANCTAWFDATQTSSITLNGTTVASISNLVPGGTSYAQSTAVQQPTQTTLAGKNAIFFAAGNAAAPRMDGPSLTELADTSNNVLVMFFVILFTGTTNGTNRFFANVSSWRGGGSGFGWWPRYSNGDSYWDAPESTARVNGSVASTTINTAATICRIRRAGANASIHYNNVQIASRSNASGAISSNLTESTRLAGGDNTLDPNSITFSELICFSRDISAPEITAVQNALANKYKITL